MQPAEVNTVDELRSALAECQLLFRQNQKSAEPIAWQILQKAVTLKSDELIAEVYALLSSMAYAFHFDAQKSMELARLAVQQSDHLQPGISKITALNQLAAAHQYIGDYAVAVSLLHECLRLFEFYELTGVDYYFLHNRVNKTLGIVYNNMGLSGLSQKYLEAAFDYALKLNEERLLLEARTLLANNLMYNKRYAEALEQYQVLLKEHEAIGEESDQLALVHNYMGRIYREQENYELAEKHFWRAIVIREKIGNELRTVYSYFSWACLMYMLKRKQEGDAYFEKVKDILNRHPERWDAQLVNDIYYEIYAAQGEYQKAYEYFRKMELAYVDRTVMEKALNSIFENESIKQRHIKEQADQLARLNEDMRDYAKTLELSNKDLKTYAHTTSHDLREPLRMISTYMTILEAKLKDKLTEEEKVFLHFAVDGSLRMDEMITRILNSAKGGKSVTLKPVELNSIIEQVKVNLTRLLQDKKAIVIAENLPVIIGDDVQLLQVFQNLISNAIKYNNSIVPQVKVTADRENGLWVIAVADNGVGIPEAERERAFEMFQRVDNTSGAEGTGIGLSTVKSIVEKMKGRIWIESNLPQGTIFKVELPGQ